MIPLIHPENILRRALYWEALKAIRENAYKFSDKEVKHLKDLAMLIWTEENLEEAKTISANLIKKLEK